MSDQNDIIKSYVIKIEENGMYIQSGVLWAGDNLLECAYVFTVKHGIEHNHTTLNIRYWCGTNEIVLPVNRVLLHPDKDAAILIVQTSEIRILQPYTFLELDHLEALISNNSSMAQLKIFGYPELRCNENYPGPNQQLDFSVHINNYYEDVNKGTFIARYSNDTTFSDPDAELKGFSGGGLFAFFHGKVFLCGIYRGSPSEAVHYNDLNIISLRVVMEICELNKLPNFKFTSLIPNLLNKHLGLCLEELGKGHILFEYLKNIYRCNYIEIIKASCSHCDPCEYREHFYLCDRFQQQLLNCSALLYYHNSNFNEKENLKVLKENIYYEVRIICSDVRPTRVSKLIRNLKQDYFGKNKLANNTLVLWASKEPYKKSESNCTFEEYQNIISNITETDFHAFDYSYINEVPEKLAILNISYILDEMENDSNSFSDFINGM